MYRHKQITCTYDIYDKVLKKAMEGAKYEQCVRYMYIFSLITGIKY